MNSLPDRWTQGRPGLSFLSVGLVLTPVTLPMSEDTPSRTGSEQYKYSGVYVPMVAVGGGRIGPVASGQPAKPPKDIIHDVLREV